MGRRTKAFLVPLGDCTNPETLTTEDGILLGRLLLITGGRGATRDGTEEGKATTTGETGTGEEAEAEDGKERIHNSTTVVMVEKEDVRV